MIERATLVRLGQEVRRDLAACERLLAELRPHAERLRGGADPVLAGYVAVTLHQLYTALETAFERVCRAFEGAPPSAQDSHQALLRDMALELPDIRPAVITDETLAALAPVLRFRHFVRHAYAVAWDSRRLVEMWERCERAHSLADADLRQFLDFVDSAAKGMSKGRG